MAKNFKTSPELFRPKSRVEMHQVQLRKVIRLVVVVVSGERRLKLLEMTATSHGFDLLFPQLGGMMRDRGRRQSFIGVLGSCWLKLMIWVISGGRC
ncbi:hypothetical protein TorRG33x02_272810 [Trema orientale]|uniref:Uncharacterized protein n=1 Tax=Trema orientale TaxID=63057 RepID=A0A2P5CUE9_TREOI|nr:hypothetical protein TorRG33x02_272810 [Trema orientale]